MNDLKNTCFKKNHGKMVVESFDLLSSVHSIHILISLNAVIKIGHTSYVQQ